VWWLRLGFFGLVFWQVCQCVRGTFKMDDSDSDSVFSFHGFEQEEQDNEEIFGGGMQRVDRAICLFLQFQVCTPAI
jgi:hypothetical protein